MNFTRIVFLMVIILTIVAGCGDRQGARRIVCFGDSLTAGPQLKAGEKYPARLQKILAAHGYKYEVINAGISGDTTAGGLERIDSYLHQSPDILILELGTNDAFTNVPAETIKNNLAGMIRRVQAANVTVILAGIEAPPGVLPEYTEQLPKLYLDLAEEHKVRLIKDFMKEVRGTPGAMRKDGVHYKARGAEILAQSMFQEIEPLLAR